MNTKRVVFWSIFVIVIALIVWGLAVAMKKSANTPGGLNLGTPAAVTDTDHVMGSADAPVTLIEYSDFQCPACEMYYPLVTKLLSDEGSTTVRFVYRHFPLSQHANAVPASMASEAAGLQGKFWEMYDLIFANHTDWTELPDPTSVFVGYATRLGLDITKFKSDLNNPVLRSAIQANTDEGIKIGINQTPTFFVNGKAIVNPQSYEAFKAIIDAAASGSAK